MLDVVRTADEIQESVHIRKDFRKSSIFRMSLSSIPKNDRNLRACLICSMVKSLDLFDRDGCDNCERFLKIKGNRSVFQLLRKIHVKFRDSVLECTSANFDGLIGMMHPPQSW